MHIRKLKGKSASYILLYLAIAGAVILAGPKLPLIPDGRSSENRDASSVVIIATPTLLPTGVTAQPFPTATGSALTN